MKIVLNNKKYRNENNICKVWIDDKESDTYKFNPKDSVFLDIPEGSDVKIEIQNDFLKEKKKGIFLFFYWVVCVLTGYGERLPFGMPFHAVLRIRNVGKEDIFIETNSMRSKEAFEVKTDCDVVENQFISPKGYKKWWLLGYALPVSLLLLAILLLVALVEYQERFYVVKWVLVSIMIIWEMAWVGYVVGVLKK